MDTAGTAQACRLSTTFRNSWGEGVQDQGYFYMPYAYITDANLADDFWTIRKIKG